MARSVMCFLGPRWQPATLPSAGARPAANAQPFFALTPVYAAAWARMLLDEPLPPELLATAGVMIAGALLAASDRHGHRLEPKEARSEERELKLVEMEQGAMKVHAV